MAQVLISMKRITNYNCKLIMSILHFDKCYGLLIDYLYTEIINPNWMKRILHCMPE